MKIIKSEFQKKIDKNINKIKKASDELRKEGFTIEKELTETMIGTEVNHIYLRDKLNSGKIILQKHLFTLDNKKIRIKMKTEIEKITIGEQLADILMLRKDKGYEPERYKTLWGNKTFIGLYETVKRIIEG